MKILRKLTIFLFLVVFMISPIANVDAAWIWTKDTRKWINPKYSVKETPQEQLEFALAYHKNKDYKRAVKAFQKLMKNFPKAREAADAQFFIAEIFSAQKKYVKAFKAYQEVIDRYPFNERGGEIVKKQYDIGLLLLEGLKDKNSVYQTIVGGDYNVIEIFRSVIKNAPYGELAAPSQYKIALYLKESGLLKEAREEFEKTINDYPQTEWAKASKYQVALSDSQRSADAQHDQKITQEAIEEFSEFIEEYPNAEMSKKARAEISRLRSKEAKNTFLVAKYYEKQKKYEAARLYYGQIVDKYKDTPWAKKALKKLRELSSLDENL